MEGMNKFGGIIHIKGEKEGHEGKTSLVQELVPEGGGRA
jgi:hypothetical protein